MARVRDSDMHKWGVNTVFRHHKGIRYGPYAVVSRTEPDGRHTLIYLGKANSKTAPIYVDGKFIDLDILNEKFPPGARATKEEILRALGDRG